MLYKFAFSVLSMLLLYNQVKLFLTCKNKELGKEEMMIVCSFILLVALNFSVLRFNICYDLTLDCVMKHATEIFGLIIDYMVIDYLGVTSNFRRRYKLFNKNNKVDVL